MWNTQIPWFYLTLFLRSTTSLVDVRNNIECEDFPVFKIDAIAMEGKHFISLYSGQMLAFRGLDHHSSHESYPELGSFRTEIPRGLKSLTPLEAAWTHHTFYNKRYFVGNQKFAVSNREKSFKFKPTSEVPFLPKNGKIVAVFDYKDYLIIFHRKNGDTKIQVSIQSEMSTHDSTDLGLKEEEFEGLTAIDTFGPLSYEKNFIFGLKATANHSVIFRIDKKRNQIDLSARSPPLDNQVLFGCPQTFCFHARIDAITYYKGSNFSGFVVVREKYAWLLNNFGDVPRSRQALTIAGLSFERVHAMFSHLDTLYIVEHGIVYELKDPKDIQMAQNYTRSRLTDSLMAGAEAITDSIGDKHVFYAFATGKYVIFNAETLQQDKEVHSILDFRGFPEEIDAAVTFNGQIFGFRYNFVFSISEQMDAGATVELIQESFFDCRSNNFMEDYYKHTMYKTFQNLKEVMLKRVPEAYSEELHSYFWLITTSIGVILLIIVSIYVVYKLWYKRHRELDPISEYQHPVHKVSLTDTGFNLEPESLGRQSMMKNVDS